MDNTKDRFHAGRTQMITAFTKAIGHVEDQDLRAELVGEFFDGHVEIKKAFGVMCLLAHVGLPEGWERWWETTTPSATGGGMTQGRHRRPRPNLITRLRARVALWLSRL